MDRREPRDIELKYLKRDYGYYVSNNRGYATIFSIRSTSEVSYHVTAVVYSQTYSATFLDLEEVYKHLNNLFNRPSKDLLTDRRAKSLGSRIYRWLYEFMQC